MSSSKGQARIWIIICAFLLAAAFVQSEQSFPAQQSTWQSMSSEERQHYLRNIVGIEGNADDVVSVIFDQEYRRLRVIVNSQGIFQLGSGFEGRIEVQHAAGSPGARIVDTNGFYLIARNGRMDFYQGQFHELASPTDVIEMRLPGADQGIIVSGVLDFLRKRGNGYDISSRGVTIDGRIFEFPGGSSITVTPDTISFYGRGGFAMSTDRGMYRIGTFLGGAIIHRDSPHIVRLTAFGAVTISPDVSTSYSVPLLSDPKNPAAPYPGATWILSDGTIVSGVQVIRQEFSDGQLQRSFEMSGEGGIVISHAAQSCVNDYTCFCFGCMPGPQAFSIRGTNREFRIRHYDPTDALVSTLRFVNRGLSLRGQIFLPFHYQVANLPPEMRVSPTNNPRTVFVEFCNANCHEPKNWDVRGEILRSNLP